MDKKKIYTMEVIGCRQLFGYNILQNIFFGAQQKKETPTGLERREGM